MVWVLMVRLVAAMSDRVQRAGVVLDVPATGERANGHVSKGTSGTGAPIKYAFLFGVGGVARLGPGPKHTPCSPTETMVWVLRVRLVAARSDRVQRAGVVLPGPATGERANGHVSKGTSGAAI